MALVFGSQQDRNEKIPYADWLILAVAVLFAACALLYQCFSERLVYFDEVGLYNPVYMYLHYGKMTYPAHEHPEAMFVHPPVHYLLVATLMRVGLSIFHAAGLISVLLFILLAAFTVFSKFPFTVKAGLLFGMFMGGFIWNEALVLRPDLTLALSWAAGLVALEGARLDGWNVRRLVAGGFLLALATGVHYTGVAAGLGLLVYAVWICRTLPWRDARNRMLWMMVGVSVFALPDLVLFIIPHYKEIVSLSLSVERSAPPGSAFVRHLESYKVWKQSLPFFAATHPVTSFLTGFLFRWSIPAAFVGPPLLALIPATRGLALASLPHLLFLLFVARHKQLGYTGYFAPEIMLYLTAITSVSFTVILTAARRLKRVQLNSIVITCFTLTMVLCVIRDVPILAGPALVLTRGIYDLEVGRAAGRKMLGQDALVGTTSAGVWYTSGATHLEFITPDVIYPKDIRCIDLSLYLSTFDALALDPHQSWLTYNDQHESLTTWYLDGRLQLRGFFFADRRFYYESLISYMLYSAQAPKRLIGYGARGSNVFRFEQEEQGDQVMISALCPVSYGERGGAFDNTELKLDFFAIFFRPIASNVDPRSLGDRKTLASLITFIAPRDRLERQLRPGLNGCTIRNEVPGRLLKSNLQRFLRESDGTDQTIHFYQNYADLRTRLPRLPNHPALPESSRLQQNCNTSASLPSPDGRVTMRGPPPGFAFQLPGAVPLNSIVLAYSKASIDHGTVIKVTTASEQWAYAASIPIIMDHLPGTRRFVHIRGRVLAGQIGAGILDRHTNSFQVEHFLDPTSDTQDFYIPVVDPNRADDLVIRNTAGGNQKSQMLIEATEVLASARRLDNPTRLDQAELAYEKAKIQLGKQVTITTAPQQWAYAAAIPVRFPPGITQGVALRLRARVLKGEVGFGLLSADRKSFLVEQRYPASEKSVEVLLPITRTEQVSDLIVRNTASGDRASVVVLESLDMWEMQK